MGHYVNGANTLDVFEGNVCDVSPNPCADPWHMISNQPFSSLSGEFGSTGSKWTMWVQTAPRVQYMMIWHWHEQAASLSYAAAMHKIS